MSLSSVDPAVIASFIALAGVIYSTRMGRQIAQINRAVNHVGPEQPKLYQMVAESRADVRALDRRVDRVENKLDSLCASS